MKLLLCERSLSGHRRNYIQWLSAIQGIDFYFYGPENLGFPPDRFYKFEQTGSMKSFSGYAKWIRQIRRIVKDNRIDSVHIADGDSIMRFFGYGLHSFGKARVIITYHHFFTGTARRISYRMMNAGRSHCCVVHTDTLLSEMKKIGVGNVIHCDYPSFDFDLFSAMDPAECRRRFGLADDIPVIGIIGGMTAYKRIIPFLLLMRKCGADFRLLICGRPSDISEQNISEAVAPYKEKVHTLLRPLSDEEYKAAVAASDIIYCLYGREFNGASGPLTDGVCCRRMILSCDHGSLGEITAQNHLGVTADVTDGEDILQKTEAALRQALDFQYDEKAEAYREQLNPEHFLETYKMIYEHGTALPTDEGINI